MALSGNFTTGSVTAFGVTTRFTFAWSATQSPATNSSTVTWSVTTVQTPTGSGYTRGVRKVSVDINGSNVKSQVWPYDNMFRVSNGTVLASGTTTVSHNDDGTKSFPVTLMVNVGQMNENSYTHSKTVTFTLDTIALASTITAENSAYVSTPTSITVTQGSTSYSHILLYKLSSASTYTEIGRNVGTKTYSWTTPATAGTYDLLVRTYTNGSYTGDPLTSSATITVGNRPSATGNLLRLSDGYYWDGAASTFITRNGVQYVFTDVLGLYQICAGRVNIGTIENTTTEQTHGQIRATVTFAKPFTKVPQVIICDGSNIDSNYMGRFMPNVYGRQTGGVIENGPTTTEFQIQADMYKGITVNNVFINWLAIAPITDLTGVDKKTKGTLQMPTPITSGMGLKLSDDNYWALESIYDNNTGTEHKTLKETYFTFDCGKATPMQVAGGSNVAQIINFNKTFVNPPIVLCSLNGSSYWFNWTTGRGQVSASISCYLAGGATPTTFDNHKQAQLRYHNAWSSQMMFGADWIAFGEVAEL